LDNREAIRPPEVLHLLAHPLRWQLLVSLKKSDQRVQELVEHLQQPYNLVSYHLKLLHNSGFVSQRKSDADGRDSYYHLILDKLQAEYQAAGLAISPSWNWIQIPPKHTFQTPMRVLFLCTHNSARSQMAEGLLRHLGGDNFLVTSAGSQPHPVHPDAIAAMNHLGIDISQQHSKHLDDIKGQGFDVAITVCDRVREECLNYNFCQSNIHWSIADPSRILEPMKRQQAFTATAQELALRIRQFMPLLYSSPHL
jgi:protein-tyrosine-phosphatase